MEEIRAQSYDAVKILATSKVTENTISGHITEFNMFWALWI